MEKEIQVFNSRSDLSKPIADLVDVAAKALNDAYAPYSNFYVGAAVLLEDGTVVKGSNFENASYPLCLCAERVALGSVHSQYPGAVVKSIAVTAKNPKQAVIEPVAPCGACRQVIAEFNNINIIMTNSEKEMKESTASELLPLAFDDF